MILAFLLVFNGNYISGYSAPLKRALYKDGELLKDGDEVSVTDKLFWQVTLDQKKLEEGYVVKLPQGVIPDVTGGNVDGIPAKIVAGRDVQLLAEEEELLSIQSNHEILSLKEDNTESEAEIESEPETEMKSETESETEAESETEMDSEAETEPESKAETSEDISETETGNSPVSETEQEAVRETDVQPSLESGGNLEESGQNTEEEEIQETLDNSVREGEQESNSVSDTGETLPRKEIESKVILASDSQASLQRELQTVEIPCVIDPSKVVNGTIMIDGMMLLVSLVPEEGIEVHPDLVKLVYPEGDSPDAYPEVKEGSDISLKDQLAISFKWDSLEEVKPGDYFEYELPDAFGIPGSSGSSMMLADINAPGFPREKPFAQLSWEAGSKKLKVVFQDMGVYPDGTDNEALSQLHDAYVTYKCTLDKDADHDPQGKVIIPLGSSSVTVTVTEFKPSPPKIKKDVGVLDDKGEVEWTVTYTHPTDAYTGEKPDRIEDILPKGLEYVAGSGTVILDGTDETSLRFSEESGQLTCSLDGISAGQKIVFTYKTRLSDEELQKVWKNPNITIQYENTANATNNGSPVSVEGSGKATLKVRGDSWNSGTFIKKVGTLPKNLDPDQAIIKWEVTVNTAGRSFKTLQIEDTMGRGLLLDKDSISVNNASPVYTPEIEKTGEKNQMNLPLIKASDSQAAENTYTISYTTKIDPEYFNQTSDLTDEDIKNEARLIYEWPSGSGLTPVDIPTVTKAPVGINNSLLNKRGVTYDTKDHSLTWRVTVNPNKVDLTEVTLVDDLSESNAGHRFTSDTLSEEQAREIIKSEVKKALSSIGTAKLESINLDDNKLTLHIKGLGNNLFSFSFKTYISDSEFWAGNQSKDFFNTMTMLEEGTKVGNTRIKKDISSDANIPASSEVLRKEAVFYNPETKRVTWRLIINNNETDLGTVTITDIPGQYLSDPQDARLNDKTFMEPNTFTADGNKITIHLDGVKERQVITYTTAVDVDGADFINKSEVELSNSAELTSSSNAERVILNPVTVKLSNKVLTKNSPGREGLVAHYAVELNPLGLDLSRDISDHKLQLEDTLPDGLYLDLDSLKMYKANVKESEIVPAGGTCTVQLEKGDEVIPAAAYDSSNRKLTVDIPDPEGRYLLYYDAYIVRIGVELKNDIQLIGSVLPDGGELGKSSRVMSVASAGGARLGLPKDKFISVQIKKTDNNGTILKGAEFGLFQSTSDTEPLVKGTSDDTTGICTLGLSRKSVKGTDYLYWRELKAPQGYALSDGWHTIKLSEHDSDTVLTAVNVKEDEKNSGEIRIRKLDEQNLPLQDAVFSVYEDEACKNPVMAEGQPLTKSSDPAGQVLFNGLYPGQTYYVKETKAPDGYVLSDKITAVAAEKDWSDPDKIRLINEKADVTLKVQKIDGQNQKKTLPGAVFQLFEDNQCTVEASQPVTSGEDGNVLFTGLLPHHTYYLKEIKVPSGYIMSSDVITIRTEENHQVLSSMRIENYPVGWDEKASIHVTKTSEDGKKKLSGATFALYRQDRLTLTGEQTTGEDGTAGFTGLKEGTYYLKEVAAPEGYQLSADWIKVSVARNSAEKVSVKNKELPPKPTEESGNPGGSNGSGDPDGTGGSGNPESPGSSGGSSSPKGPEGSGKNNPGGPGVSIGSNNPEDLESSYAANETQGSAEETNSITVETELKPTGNMTSGKSSIPKTGISDDSGIWKAGAMIFFAAGAVLCLVWRTGKKKGPTAVRFRFKKKN